MQKRNSRQNKIYLFIFLFRKKSWVNKLKNKNYISDNHNSRNHSIYNTYV